MAPRGPPGSRRTLAVPRPPGGRGAAPRVRCRPGRVGGGGGAARAAAPGRPGGSSADTRRERLRGRSGPGATEGPRGPGWSARGRVPPPSHAVGPRPAPHTPVRSVTLTSRSRSPCPRLTRPSPRGPPLTRPDPHLTQPVVLRDPHLAPGKVLPGPWVTLFSRFSPHPRPVCPGAVPPGRCWGVGSPAAVWRCPRRPASP